MTPSKVMILKRSDYIGIIRSNLSELDTRLKDMDSEVLETQSLIEYGKEHKLKAFVKLEKFELKVLRSRMKRVKKSIKDLQKVLVLAEKALG